MHNYISLCTVKPVLIGHLWSFKTDDLLREVQFILQFLRKDKNNITF
jgi:hypothetical protein